MAFIHYLHAHYGLVVRPGKKHFCPVCNRHHRSLAVKRDGRLF